MTVSEILKLYHQLTLGKIHIPNTDFIKALPLGHSLSVMSTSRAGLLSSKLVITKDAESMILYQRELKDVARGNIPCAQDLSENIPGTLDAVMVDAYTWGGFEQAMSHLLISHTRTNSCKVILGLPTSELNNQESMSVTLSLT